MTVGRLRDILEGFPQDMEIRGMWEGIDPTIKAVYKATIQVDERGPREIVLIDVDQHGNDL